MRCPYCSNNDTRVMYTRMLEDNTVIKRKRQCGKCGEKFVTFERCDVSLMVVKENNTRESFNRDKIIKGIRLACNKRPVSAYDIDNIAKEIENSVLNSSAREIRTSEIGRMVMEKLKDLDEVAYVRFASVYRKFTDLESFVKELEMLKSKKKT